MNRLSCRHTPPLLWQFREPLTTTSPKFDEKYSQEWKQKQEENTDSLSTRVFKIPGEPAEVIIGLPPVSLTDGTLFVNKKVTDRESEKNESFVDWLVRREVRKNFREQLYKGKVMAFDEESSWTGWCMNMVTIKI